MVALIIAIVVATGVIFYFTKTTDRSSEENYIKQSEYWKEFIELNKEYEDAFYYFPSHTKDISCNSLNEFKKISLYNEAMKYIHEKHIDLELVEKQEEENRRNLSLYFSELRDLLNKKMVFSNNNERNEKYCNIFENMVDRYKLRIDRFNITVSKSYSPPTGRNQHSDSITYYLKDLSVDIHTYDSSKTTNKSDSEIYSIEKISVN